MGTTKAEINKIKPHFLFGPGDAIEEERKEIGLSQEELADILSISLKHLNEIINNKRPLSFETCMSLSKVFSTSTEYWAKVDLNYRIENSTIGDKDEEIKTKTRLYQAMPILELYKKNWLSRTDNFEDLKSEVANFWNMPSFDIDHIEEQTRCEIKTRISMDNMEKLNTNSLRVWQQFAHQMSKNQKVSKFSKTKLEDLCNNILNFTNSKDSISLFIDELNECGIKFILCPHLQKTYLDGAVFYDKKNPVIGYTSRYNRLDNFWWTICHELGHIVLGHLSQENPILIDNKIESSSPAKEEKEADEFAGKLLKKEEIVNYFNGINITEDRVIRISEEFNLHPSIVVGVLAHDGMISYVHKNRFNEPVQDELEKYYYN